MKPNRIYYMKPNQIYYTFMKPNRIYYGQARATLEAEKGLLEAGCAHEDAELALLRSRSPAAKLVREYVLALFELVSPFVEMDARFILETLLFKTVSAKRRISSTKWRQRGRCWRRGVRTKTRNSRSFAHGASI